MISSEVQRASGIIVPARLATMPDRGTRTPKGPAVAYDPDGRRRIVIDVDQRRKLDRLLKAMKATGQTVVMACREDFRRADGTKSCGQPMLREPGDGGTTYVCACTRIHVAA